MPLDNIPQEVVEHIAYYAATRAVLGPPAGIIPLLLANRKIHALLSFASNPHLYARIFQQKFDPTVTRLDADVGALADELRRRCTYLRRIKERAACTVDPILRPRKADQDLLHEILWMSLLMTLENAGKNEEQLRTYARIDGWLRLFWFDDAGASLTNPAKRERWPLNNEFTSLAMWLFWFFLRPEDYASDSISHGKATDLVKLIALGAHQYHLSAPYSADFQPDPTVLHGVLVTHYARTYRLIPPPITAPAVLCYLSLINCRKNARAAQLMFSRGQKDEWGPVWARCLGLSEANSGREVGAAFELGSLNGIWEGIFTYTEFTAYAALLSGAPPLVLLNSLVAQHRHTWKLREYHFTSAYPISRSSSGSARSDCAASPISPGDPLRGFLPEGARMEENQEEGIVEVWERGKDVPLVYRSAAEGEGRVRDVLIVGEGHSSWGQFNLLGRIRPWDGFICLSKEYVDGDRGKWLYRGYLLGNAEGHIAGRWRDTLSPPNVPGYEGCFAMSRRR
ncbi:hypothetical protein OE88DRAFT_1664754 [Heliocybe sulcata]|uniref:Uncharacterized protein n=1 Tax=Heliocybe sulcata TaxID=5364 RepID=A0A5C3MRZ2_9AGAM|nr:hypothetical protein OE88DRAFT_1664754 [Heliocybe sulcata]